MLSERRRRPGEDCRSGNDERCGSNLGQPALAKPIHTCPLFDPVIPPCRVPPRIFSLTCAFPFSLRTTWLGGQAGGDREQRLTRPAAHLSRRTRSASGARTDSVVSLWMCDRTEPGWPWGAPRRL